MAGESLRSILHRRPDLLDLQVPLPARHDLTAVGRRVLSTMGRLGSGPAAVRALHLADTGQRVRLKPDAEVTPEVSDEDRGQVYEVKAAVGQGEDQFVRLTTVDGDTEIGWFRTTQLEAADAPNKTKEGPMPPSTPDAAATTTLMARAQQVAAERGIDLSTRLRDAVKLAGAADEALAERYRESFGSPTFTDDVEPTVTAPVINLHRQPNESFFQLVTRVNHERSLNDWKAAYRLCADAFPDLAEQYGQGSF